MSTVQINIFKLQKFFYTLSKLARKHPKSFRAIYSIVQKLELIERTNVYLKKHERQALRTYK